MGWGNNGRQYAGAETVITHDRVCYAVKTPSSILNLRFSDPATRNLTYERWKANAKVHANVMT